MRWLKVYLESEASCEAFCLSSTHLSKVASSKPRSLAHSLRFEVEKPLLPSAGWYLYSASW